MVSRRERAINEVLRKQRNADRKVSRLEHQAIRIRNTSENPHKTPAQIRSMSNAELREHRQRLDQFTSRDNKYVQGVDNAPIRKSLIDRYTALQNKLNKVTETVEARVKPLKLPGSDTTVETLMRNRKRIDQQGMEQSGTVLTQNNRTAANFKTNEGLERAIADLRNKMSDRTIRTTIDKRLNSIRAALTYSGNVELLDQLEELNWSEKLMLLDYSQFGSIAQLNIDSEKYDSSGNIRDSWKQDHPDEVDDLPMQDSRELFNDLREQLQWVRDNARRASIGSARKAARKADD